METQILSVSAQPLEILEYKEKKSGVQAKLQKRDKRKERWQKQDAGGGVEANEWDKEGQGQQHLSFHPPGTNQRFLNI